MDDAEIEGCLKELILAGLAMDHGNGNFSLTDAGKDYVEAVLLAGVTESAHVYALGRAQGLREAEAAATPHPQP